MRISDWNATDYAANVVVCKLWGLVGSPTEFIFGLAIFNKLNELPGRKCWVYSADEYRQAVVEPEEVDPALIALVPQLPIREVGDVDLGVFIPSYYKRHPMVVAEIDGHQFHERTVEQASNDRRRDRRLLRYRVPLMRFTGTDVVRGSEEFAQEVVDFIGESVNRISAA
jgi:very-short-patch-repair endonuclease